MNESYEALVAAQELMQFLWNNVSDGGDSGRIEIKADPKTADALCELMTDAKSKIENAIHGLEIALVKTI